MTDGPILTSNASWKLACAAALALATSLHGQAVELTLTPAAIEEAPDAAPPPAQSSDPANHAQLLDANTRRDRAAVLVAELLQADSDRLDEIEAELAQLGDAARIEIELAALSGDFSAQRRAEQMSHRIRWRQAASPALLAAHPKLVAILSAGTPNERAALVDEIGQAQMPESMSLLMECVRDPQPYVRQRAIDALVSLGTRYPVQQEPIAELFESILRTGDQDAQLLMISALSNLKAARPQVLAPLLASPSEEVRRTVILALGHSGQSNAIAHILPMLRDEQWQVRAAALDALDSLSHHVKSNAQASQAVGMMLADPDAFVRARAMRLLATIDSTAGTAEMERMLKAGEGDERALLEALAQLQRPLARDRIIEQYRQAEPADRGGWLTMLQPFQDVTTDQLLLEVLDDAARRDEWPVVLQMWRRNRDAFHSAWAAKLLDADAQIAQAAWEQLPLTSQPLPDDVAEALRIHPEPFKRMMALRAAYMSDLQPPIDAITAAMEDASPEVAELALGMAMRLQIGTSLDVALPARTRRDASTSQAMEQHASTQPAAQAAIATVASRLLGHDDRAIAVRAAVLLYRMNEAPPPQAIERLTAGAAADDPAIRRLALAGIAERPAPFVDTLDVDALLANAATRAGALRILATSDRPHHRERFAELVAGADVSDAPLIAAMVVARDDATRRQAIQLWRDAGSHANRGALFALFEQTANPHVGHFLEEVLDPESADDRMINLILKLPDTAAGPALEKVLSIDTHHWYDRESAIRRLAAIDLAAAQRAMLAMLDSPQARWQAQRIIFYIEPDAALAAKVIAMRQANDLWEDWRRIIDWLPEEYIFEMMLPSLASQPFEAQEAVLARVGRGDAKQSLVRLLNIAVEDGPTRERIATLVAELTATADPAIRPPMQDLSSGGLAMLLSAAGDWPDTIEVIEPYLDHENTMVRDAATRGLAMHLTVRPPQVLQSAHRDALARGAAADDPGLAYLSIEALAQGGDAVLAAIDPAAVKGMVPRLRLILAGVDVPEREEVLAKARTGQHGLTALRFAIEVGLEARSGAALPATLVWQHRDVLIPWATEAGDLRVLEPAVINNLIRPDDPGYAQVAGPLLELARAQKKAELFAALAVGGAVEEPTAADLGLLLRYAAEQTAAPYGVWPDRQIRLARQWAKLHPDTIESLAARRSVVQLVANVVAIEALESEAARDRLTKLIIQPQTSGMIATLWSPTARRTATEALARLGRPADLQPFIDAARTIASHDFQAMRFHAALIEFIAQWDPPVAVELVQEDEADDVALLIADDRDALALIAPRAEHALLPILQQAHAQTIDMPAHDKAMRSWGEIDPFAFVLTQLGEPGESVSQDIEAELELDAIALPEIAETIHQHGHRDPPAWSPTFVHLNASYTGPGKADRQAIETALTRTLKRTTHHLSAMRHAADLMVMSAADDIAAGLASDDEQVRSHAAAALAVLRQRDAAGPIAAALEQTTTFSHRVELAMQLHLLGDGRGEAVLDRAETLLLTRRLRARAMSADQVTSHLGGGHGYEQESQPLSMTATWIMPLQSIRGVSLGEREKKLHMMPTVIDEREQAADITSQALVVDPNWRPGPVALLPGATLGVDNYVVPAFASLMNAEAYLEALYFVQFAHEVDGSFALERRWADWWMNHGDDSPRQWWSMAVEQSLEEMGHAKWWYRVRGWRRYQRLTGQKVELPPLFDGAAWANMISAERQRELAGREPVELIIEQARAAKLEGISEGDDRLAALVRIAGWADTDLSVAARLQLNHWPDREAVLRAGLAWQRSPSPDLRYWLRNEMSRRTGEIRMVYDALDRVESAQ